MARPEIWARYAPQFISDLKKDFGLEPWQAAGFPGNFAVESSYFTDIVEDGAKAKGWKGGHGWGQWTGMTDNNPRRREFEKWLARMSRFGYRADNYLGNYSYLYRELKGAEGRRVLPRLRAARNTNEAAEIVCRVYERPAAKSIANSLHLRKAAALEAYKLWLQKPPSPTIWPADKLVPAPEPTMPAEPTQPKTPLPPTPELPDSKSPFNSRTIVTVIGTIAANWLVAKGLPVDDATREGIMLAVTTVGAALAGWFHKIQSRPISGSPLAREIEAAKQAIDERTVYYDLEEARPQTAQPAMNAVVLTEEGFVDVGKLTTEQFLQLMRDLNRLREDWGYVNSQLALPAPTSQSTVTLPS